MSDLMECGHAANAVSSAGKPCCAICIGLHPGAETVDKNPPDVLSRKAVCPYCKRETGSSFELPFFEYRSKHETDWYYCGCRGWD